MQPIEKLSPEIQEILSMPIVNGNPSIIPLTSHRT